MRSHIPAVSAKYSIRINTAGDRRVEEGVVVMPFESRLWLPGKEKVGKG